MAQIGNVLLRAELCASNKESLLQRFQFAVSIDFDPTGHLDIYIGVVYLRDRHGGILYQVQHAYTKFFKVVPDK